jgi:hypothetical protein
MRWPPDAFDEPRHVERIMLRMHSGVPASSGRICMSCCQRLSMGAGQSPALWRASQRIGVLRVGISN